MTIQEKKKKAAMIAVAYYLEQEAEKPKLKRLNSWRTVGQEVIMNNRALVQRRGRTLS